MSSLSSFSVSVATAIDRHPLIVPPETPLVEAIALMGQVRSRCALSSTQPSPNFQVGEETRASYVCAIQAEEAEPFVGLLGERDLIRFFSQGTNLENLTVAEAIVPNAIALRESQCWDLFCLVSLLQHQHLRHLPLLGDGGQLVGVVTADTLCQILPPLNLLQWRLVGDMMIPEVIQASPTTSLFELAQLMAQYRVSSVVLCEESQEASVPVGIVTEVDLVQIQVLGLDARKLQAQTVMTSPPCCVSPSDSLWNAHQQMQQRQVRQAIVQGTQGELVGLLTQSRILRSLSPMELYSGIEELQQQIRSLEAEKMAIWQKHHEELEQEKDKFALLGERLQQEIEERQIAEAARKASEELAYATFEGAAVSLFHSGLDGHLLRVNSQFSNLVGYSHAELRGKSLLELMHPEDPQPSPQWLEALQTGKRSTISREQRYLHQDGLELWVNLTLSLVRDGVGEPDFLIGMLEDISERKYGEQLLQDSEERFQATFEQAAVGMEICTLEGRFFRVNQKFCDLVGYGRVELLERTVQDITHPEDCQKSQEHMRQLLGGEIPHYLMEKRYICKDGSSVWVSVMLSLMRESTGDPKYFIGVVQDIDARKRAEFALRQSERRFRSMFESHKSIMLLIEPDYGAIIDANFAAEKFYSLTQDELCRLTIFDLHHLSRDQVEQEMKKAKLELQNSFVFPHQQENGELRWVEGFSSPIEYHGKQLLFAIIHDITDRKNAEEALRDSQHFVQQIADSTPNILYVYDLIEQRHTYVNHEIITILGYMPEDFESMDAERLKATIYPDDYTRFLEYLQRFNTAQVEDVFELEYRMQHANGQWRWLYRRDTLFNRTERGKPQQILGTATDITERKQIEERLQQANQELKGWVSQLELRNREMKLLGKMSEFLQACLTVEEAYGAIADLLQPFFPHCSGGVFMLNAPSNLVEAVAIWGSELRSETLFSLNECWSLRRGLLHEAQQTRSSLFCKHVHRAPSPTETLCVPLMAQGETMGLLYLSSLSSEQLNEGKQQLARTVSEHLSLALANLKLRETLHNKSIRDPLTGLFNRRYMEEALQQELHRAERGKYPLGIVMIDVDRFKKYNDTWGHEAGDIVLRELGTFLQGNIGVSDIACRYGGEELTLILPETSLEDSIKRAEDLCQGVRQLNLHYQTQSLGQITISLGLACFPEHGKTGEALIQRADAALYRAKAEGRDRVVY